MLLPRLEQNPTEPVVDGVFVCNAGKAFLMSLEMIISVFPELKHLWPLNAPRSVQGPTQSSWFHPDQLSSFDFGGKHSVIMLNIIVKLSYFCPVFAGFDAVDN